MSLEQRRTAADPQILAWTQGLVNYVRELVQSRRRPVRDSGRYPLRIWLASLPESAERPDVDHSGTLLTLDYRPSRAYPRAPRELDGWLDHGRLDRPEQGDPELAEEGPIRTGDVSAHRGTATIPRAQAESVLRAYEAWLPTWRRWANDERAAKPHRDLYRKLSEMSRRLTQEDDRYEAIIGVGLIASTEEERPKLERHVITKRITIKIARDTARLTVALTNDTLTRFEDREFLDEADGYLVERAEHVRSQLALDEFHPLSERVCGLLEEWAQLAFDRAVRFSKSYEPQPPDRILSMTLAPAIMLRERDSNALSDYYDHIARSLNGPDARSPLGLAQLVSPLEPEERLAWEDVRGTTPTYSPPPEADPLFPLPANEAQRGVLSRMRSDTAVVVQGPPGTGKTHTIANLICALLAQGQRVLVTSQKDQALRELRDKLPRSARDLCVLMTGDQRNGTDELDRSITALSEQVSSSDPSSLELETLELVQQRNNLLGKRTDHREAIRQLREAEWTEYPEVAVGYGGRLAMIAARVVAEEKVFSWLPRIPETMAADFASSNVPPMSATEILELRSLLAGATVRRETRRGQRLPDLAQLIAPETFADTVSAVRRAADVANQAGNQARALANLGPDLLNEIERQTGKARVYIRHLQLPLNLGRWDQANWRARALENLFSDTNSMLWQNINAAASEIEDVQELLNSHAPRGVELPDLPLRDITAMVRMGSNLREHLGASGQIRRMFPSAAQRAAQPLLDSCRIEGRPPHDGADVEAVVAWLRIRVTITRLSDQWSQVGVQVADLAEPAPVALSKLTDLSNQLAQLTAIREVRTKINTLLLNAQLPIISSLKQWDAFQAAAAKARLLLRAQREGEILRRLASLIPPSAADNPPELADLRNAVRDQDAARYAAALAGLRTAQIEHHDQQRCDELLSRLTAFHPTLASQLSATSSEPEWDERHRAWPSAWGWAKARAFCERAQDARRDGELQRELDETEWQIRTVTEKLATTHAWLHCLRRMTQEQQQALQSYRAAMGTVGKGTGRGCIFLRSTLFPGVSVMRRG